MRKKPGTVPKGDRSPITVRVPRSHRQLYERGAAKAGLPLGDYLALVLARAHQLDDPDYIHRGQQGRVELPLGA